jgi:hypothetical protein
MGLYAIDREARDIKSAAIAATPVGLGRGMGMIDFTPRQVKPGTSSRTMVQSRTISLWILCRPSKYEFRRIYKCRERLCVCRFCVSACASTIFFFNIAQTA